MRNHVIDNSAILAKQIAERKAYTAQCETKRVLAKYAAMRALKAQGAEVVKGRTRAQAIEMGLIKAK